MVDATALKNGTTFLLNNKPVKVVSYSHTKIGRGGATVKVSLRNLMTGKLEEKTFNGQVKFEEISTLKRRLQFLYVEDETAAFMDPSTYEQIELEVQVLGDDLKYVKEGEEVNVLFWDNKALSVELPPNVVLTIEETTAGVKGNSATNVYKPSKVNGGLEVKVPLFIKVGDKVRVDTRTGEYVERVN